MERNANTARAHPSKRGAAGGKSENTVLTFLYECIHIDASGAGLPGAYVSYFAEFSRTVFN